VGLGDALGIGRTRSELPNDDDGREKDVDGREKERELNEPKDLAAAWASEYQSPRQQTDTKTASEKFRSFMVYVPHYML
jgi:hypothetical protein